MYKPNMFISNRITPIPFGFMTAVQFLKDKDCNNESCFVDERMDVFSVFDDPLGI